MPPSTLASSAIPRSVVPCPEQPALAFLELFPLSVLFELTGCIVAKQPEVDPVEIARVDCEPLTRLVLVVIRAREDMHIHGAAIIPRRLTDFHGELLEAGQGGFGRVGVERGDAAGMARIPSFQEVERLGAAYLADDDPVGPQAQC